MFEYKARAELFDDIVQVINALNINEIRFRNKIIKTTPVGGPQRGTDTLFDETEWEFTCELPINKLVKIIKEFTNDCHIIYGTLNYKNLYDGIRNYER